MMTWNEKNKELVYYYYTKLLFCSNACTVGSIFSASDIVEAMSARLIPITPNWGGDAEFVPSHYQYQLI